MNTDGVDPLNCGITYVIDGETWKRCRKPLDKKSSLGELKRHALTLRTPCDTQVDRAFFSLVGKSKAPLTDIRGNVGSLTQIDEKPE